MSNQSLRELYVLELRDLISAEQQQIGVLPSLIAASTAPMLRQALEAHLEQSRAQLERLSLLCRQLDADRSGVVCEGMAGLVREARERAGAGGEGDVRDAAVIAAAQRIEHYEIAAYGTARTWARLLGEHAGHRLLQQTLDEEAAMDRQLTELALGGINQGAEEGAGDRIERWARLRFLQVNDLDPASVDLTGVRVEGRESADLGTLDGLIVEGATGRPLYYVVDSGGWFIGRRYLVPVGRGRFEATDKRLVLDLDRDAAERYPEFNPASFLAMTDEDVSRYERRALGIFAPSVQPQASYWGIYQRLPDYQKPAWLARDPWAGAERAGGSVTAHDVAADADASALAPDGTTAPGSDALTHEEDARGRDPRLNKQGEEISQ